MGDVIYGRPLTMYLLLKGMIMCVCTRPNLMSLEFLNLVKNGYFFLSKFSKNNNARINSHQIFLDLYEMMLKHKHIYPLCTIMLIYWCQLCTLSPWKKNTPFMGGQCTMNNFWTNSWFVAGMLFWKKKFFFWIIIILWWRQNLHIT